MKTLLATLPLLLLIIAIAVYATYKKPVEPIITIAPTVIDNVRATTTPAPVQPIKEPPSEFAYNQLPEEQKRVVDRYTEKYPEIYKSFVENFEGNELAAKNAFFVRYYDENVVVIGSVPKMAMNLNIFDTKTLEKLNKNYAYLFGNYIETKNYILMMDGDHIVYYKKGETDFVTIPESQLSDKETYVAIGGIMDSYEFTFDEDTKEIKASVFKPVFDLVKENPKIRTATFVLP